MRFFLLVIVVLLFSSCAQRRVQSNLPSWQPPGPDQAFSLTGKMSFSDGRQGGSGQVDWVRAVDVLTVTLKAPLSKRSWQLTEYASHAELLFDDGYTEYAAQTDPLLDQQMGWDVPWEALKLWVRGAHTASGDQRLTEDGEVMIEDLGWRITYSRFKMTQEGQRFPSRIFARKGAHSIKLVIKQWRW